MIQEFLSELEEIYRKSGMSRSFDEYISTGKLILFTGFIASYLIFAFLHYLFRVDGVRTLSGSLALSVVSTAIIAVLYAWYPVYHRDQAASDIDSNLLYSVTFMLMLSKGGLSIERIIERVAETEPSKHISALLNKFLVNIKAYGFNPQESLHDISKRSPSEAFTKFIDGLVTTTQTSGALGGLFEYESDVLIQRKVEENQALLNNIGFLSEIYVTLLIIAPLLMIILLTTFSFISSDSGFGGINALNLVVFAGIPIISAIIMILVDMQVSID